MITSYNDEQQQTIVVVVEPNRSMSWRANMLMVVALTSLSLLLCSVFLIRGQWLVLLFVALQNGVLVVCLFKLFVRLSSKEVITISANRLVLERGRRGPEQRQSFIRPWLQLKFAQSDNPLDVGRLWLSYHGATVLLGESLGRQEKRTLYLQLRHWLSTP